MAVLKRGQAHFRTPCLAPGDQFGHGGGGVGGGAQAHDLGGDGGLRHRAVLAVDRAVVMAGPTQRALDILKRRHGQRLGIRGLDDAGGRRRAGDGNGAHLGRGRQKGVARHCLGIPEGRQPFRTGPFVKGADGDGVAAVRQRPQPRIRQGLAVLGKDFLGLGAVGA